MTARPRIIRAFGQGAGGRKVIILGISEEVWREMKEQGHSFETELDLMGVNATVIAVGGKPHNELLELIRTLPGGTKRRVDQGG